MRRALPVLTVVLCLLGWTGSAAAQGTAVAQRKAAEEALEKAQRLSDGRGIRTGRELTTALIEVARRRTALSRADRLEANSLLGRPTDPQDTAQTGGPYTTTDVKRQCTPHFCVHWVEIPDDAPDLTDTSPADGIPDYVNKVMVAAEAAWATEVVDLGWRAPKSDGALGGGDGLTDIYIKELNPGAARGLYGYANTDPQASSRSQYGFLVLDDDYSFQDFPRYGGNPDKPLQVTVAHEFNHVLQFGYDMAQDNWMYESTATWAEEKVFPSVDDYIAIYLPGWTQRPRQPITDSANGKEYGSAVWNLWLDELFGPEVIRDAWALSDTPANTVQGGGFAPKAYAAAIEAERPGFSPAFGEFAAATATWDVPLTGFPEGDKYGDVKRENASPLPADGTLRSTALDHTGFALYDIAIPDGSVGRLDLAAAFPSGTAGYVALVGDDGSAVTREPEVLPSGGGTTVSLSNPSQFSRITAVLVNTDIQNTGYDFQCEDWNWARNNQTVNFGLSAHPAGDPIAAVPPIPAATTTDCSPNVAPTPTPTATPSVTATPTPTPTVTPPVATSIRLSRNSTRISSVLRKGVLSLFAQTNKAGRHSARATVDARTAKRLKVGRRTTTAGTGRRTATAPARLKINVKLSRKMRAALKRNRRRAVKLKVAVTFAPADGTPVVRRTITIKLKP